MKLMNDKKTLAMVLHRSFLLTLGLVVVACGSGNDGEEDSLGGTGDGTAGSTCASSADCQEGLECKVVREEDGEPVRLCVANDGEVGSTCNEEEDCEGQLLCRTFDTVDDEDVSFCIPDLGECDDFDDCPGDSYCTNTGFCAPYGVPPDVINDPSCQRPPDTSPVEPVVQCEWESEDEFAHIYTTPIVADLNLDLDPGKLQPSIIVTTFKQGSGNDLNRRGKLRIFDGEECEEQIVVEGEDNLPGYGTQWAVGDLDEDVGTPDGRPELVGLQSEGDGRFDDLRLIAFRFNVDAESGTPSAERMWYGRNCATNEEITFQSNRLNFGPSLFDLDDDGIPEVVLDQVVFDANGCLLTTDVSIPDAYARSGLMVTVADVDHDGKVELVRHDRIAEWDPVTTEWKDEDYFTRNEGIGLDEQQPGHIAVVDLGDYSEINGQTSNAMGNYPEVVIVSARDANNESGGDARTRDGTIRVQSLSGEIIWGPIELVHGAGEIGGRGGPPTASDFDGDGYAEFAAAGGVSYAVYDMDCADDAPAERPGGKCEKTTYTGGREYGEPGEGVLWVRPSNDESSNATGSSIFDFNGDGASEAVYGDECYIRVYEGATGEVIFSAAAANYTGMEYPTIADVDGDFSTEIVVPRATNAAGDCPDTDPLFAGDEPVPFESKSGFMVLRDPEDKWVNSRPIWNQHAYSVTHVRDDGSYYRTSEWVQNWTVDGLNNFRQNVQGDLKGINIADLTVVFSEIEGICGGERGEQDLESQVCNRGTNPVQDGVTVAYYQGGTRDENFSDGTPVCTATTDTLLNPGDCEKVSCRGTIGADDDLFVVVDPEGTIADCHPGNNDGAGLFGLCTTILE